MNTKLEIPCAYQGGKQRLAKDIVNIIFNENEINESTRFYDLCCGTGAITIELVNRGIKPKNITMLDISVWGMFWKAVGDGNFDIDKFKEYIDSVPEDKFLIQSYIKELYKQPANIDTIYKFLLIQATSFGSKAIWLKNEIEWCTSSFRNYWQPNGIAKRKSPVNPMIPMPDTMFKRMVNIVERMKGVNVINDDINSLLEFEENSITYIDPPYQNTSGYGYSFGLNEYINKIIKYNKIYISEGIELSEKSYLLSKGRAKGGVSGNRKKANDEWLNVYEAV
ncbi:DNA adenine methylase [Neobacillus sp. YIM B02564]|uniref:site-specific DNA-methyltransferase (adenine-specific) n=1 Tax=Neobacillus paridis TaxID=2803862 RepID=A0ABS1TIG5_9BACI|nr:DNA adenine methylase [Neobacillus paridis]MBL4951057.1 DNA adenine methylase [Neobacillus paridis]